LVSNVDLLLIDRADDYNKEILAIYSTTFESYHDTYLRIMYKSKDKIFAVYEYWDGVSDVLIKV